ncbi:MAG: dialkylresorcinol condensing enzyme [Gammaproteobacteria bacterium]|nr:dialkylresorcinol condensing enzyme [Gammaproteobacteria bacterium]
MKRVLAIYYSQTGQLHQVMQRVLQPLADAEDISLHVEIIQPQNPPPFPWPILRFFDAFPESVYLDPAPIKPLTLQGTEEFDLIIIGYQVWYISPSQPITAFLQSPQAAQVLRNKPVVTVIACRNMWLIAQETMKKLLSNLGARLCANIVLTDQGSAIASLITTPRWLLTGKRNAFWGLPAAGIAAGDIQACDRFGHALQQALRADKERGPEALLQNLGAVTAKPELLISETAAFRSFRIWGGLIRRIGRAGQKRRWPILIVYIIFLICLIITVVPLSLLIQRLLRPLRQQRLKTLRHYYEMPSGN